MERLNQQKLTTLSSRITSYSPLFKCSAFLLAWSLSVIAIFEYKQSPLRAEQLRQTEEILRTQQLMQELLLRNSELQEQVHSLRGTPVTEQTVGGGGAERAQLPARHGGLDAVQRVQHAMLPPTSSALSDRGHPLASPPVRKLGNAYRGITDAASNTVTSGCLTFAATPFGFDLSVLACANSARCPLCFINLNSVAATVMFAYCSTSRRGAGSAAPAIGDGEGVELTIVNAGSSTLQIDTYTGGSFSNSGTSSGVGASGSSSTAATVAAGKMVQCYCRNGGSDTLYCTS
jgi:hypothetical protein